MTRRPLRLVCYTDALLQGGAEEALGNLLAHLGPHVRATVLAVDAAVAEALAARRPGTEVVLVPRVRAKWDVGRIAAHVRAVRALRPDIVHVNLPTPFTGQYGILGALLTPGVRVVAVEQSPISSTVAIQRWLRRLLSRRIAAHVAVGDRSARMVEEAIGLPRGRVRTIYNGIPDVQLKPVPRAAPGPVVGAMGRLSPEKGFDVLIRALPALPEVHAVLVGDGAERQTLERLAAEVGVEGRVTFTGRVPESRAYLPTFDVFVIPSRFEGLPLVAVEAMLARLPVVATDVGSVSEAVIDGETGLLVPPEDPEALAAAIRSLVHDPDRRASMGARGRERAVERFTADVVARAFEALYDEVRR